MIFEAFSGSKDLIFVSTMLVASEQSIEFASMKKIVSEK